LGTNAAAGGAGSSTHAVLEGCDGFQITGRRVQPGALEQQQQGGTHHHWQQLQGIDLSAAVSPSVAAAAAAAAAVSDSAASFLGCGGAARAQQYCPKGSSSRCLLAHTSEQQQQRAVAGSRIDRTVADRGIDPGPTGADCAGCAALSEALLEEEFLKELSTAQLTVVQEERDLLAQQNLSLVQLLADSTMAQYPGS
jgi:hypothetical protein